MCKLLSLILVSFLMVSHAYAAWDTTYVDGSFSDGDHWVEWYFGCSPTAGGVVMDYWDTRGYSGLIQGRVEDNIASLDHIATWYTSNASILSDPYTLRNDAATEGDMTDPVYVTNYVNNSIADFMGTSHGDYASTHWNSLFAPNASSEQKFNEEGIPNVASGLSDYAAYRGYDSYAEYIPYTSDLWDQFTAEIDAGRPVILYVDSGLDGIADHATPAFAYRVDGADKEVYFYSLFSGDEAGTWVDFRVLQSSARWSIMGMNVFNPAQSAPIYSASNIVSNITGTSGAISLNPGYGSAAGDTLNIRSGATVSVNSAYKAAIKGDESRLSYFLTNYTTQLRNYYLNYNTVVQENGSSVSTTGNYTPAYAIGNGNTISTDGAVTTTGSYSHGFLLNGSGNTLSINKNATISLTGASYAWGINTQGHGNNIYMNGFIDTSGTLDVGVFMNASSYLDIGATGSIVTTGSQGHGVYAQVQNWIEINGTIHTQNTNSYAVVLLTGNVVDVSGTVKVDQLASSYAFYSEGSSGRLKNVINLRTGASVTGYFANAGLNGNAEVNFGGRKDIGGNVTAIDYDFNFAYNGRFLGQTWDASCIGGETYLNGSTNSFRNLTVYNGALLGGTGTLNVSGTMNNYGVIAPGNSGIATQSLIGNYIHKAGAVYQLEVTSAGAKDRFAVIGDVEFEGGSVKIPAGTLGSFTQSYTNVFSGSTISGFENLHFVSGPLLEVTGSLNGPGTQINVDVISRDFIDIATTDQQICVAEIFDSNLSNGGDLDLVLNALKYIESAQEVEQAYNDLCGRVLSSDNQVLAEVSVNMTDLISSHVRSAGNVNPGTLSGAGFTSVYRRAEDDPQLLRFNNSSDYYLAFGNGAFSDLTAGLGLWSTANVLWGDKESTTLSEGYRYDADVLFFGADFRLSSQLLAGLAYGTSKTELDHANGDSGDIDSEYHSGYLSYENSFCYLDFVLTSSKHSHHNFRDIDFGGLNRIASSQHDSENISVYSELGKEFEYSNYSIIPIFAIQYSKTRTDSYQEDGAESISLNVRGQEIESFETSLGSSLRSKLDIESFEESYFELRFRYSRELLKNDRIFKAAFSSMPNQALEYEIEKESQDRYLIGCGLNLAKDRSWFLGLDYNFSFKKHRQEHNIGFKFRIEL